MKIAFLNPPWFDLGEKRVLRSGVRAGSRWPFTRNACHLPDQFSFGAYLPFPYFLASAAAWMQEKFPESKVVLRDSIARGESYQSFLFFLKHWHPDYIVIESGAAALKHDLRLIHEIKIQLPQVRIALAGPIAQEASLTSPEIDGFLQGEFEKNSVKFIQGASGLLPYDLLNREEMALLPYPLFDEVAALHYWDACPRGQQHPQLQLLSSRGCPYKCSFCAWPATMTGHDPDGTRPRSVRFHPPSWVEGYIRMVLEKYPIKSIYFDDDTFNLQDKHVLEICEVMERIGLPWFAMCRADTSEPATWKRMWETGCRGVKVGCESGSQRVIDQIINKHLNLERVEKEWLPLLKRIGLSVHTTWTTGLPGETAEESDETRRTIDRFYEKNLHDTHQLSGTAEIAGTPLHTLRVGQKGLAKYPGAIIDSRYQVSPDGQKKVENLQ